jgi:hypothetical protein
MQQRVQPSKVLVAVKPWTAAAVTNSQVGYFGWVLAVAPNISCLVGNGVIKTYATRCGEISGISGS